MVEAVLMLENGQTFRGKSIGAEGVRVGEVVFNTSMVGYQEILTDPSYAKQMIAFTYPHIGNVGTNAFDNESNKVYAEALIVRDMAVDTVHWRQEASFSDFLKKQQVVGISGVDTRALTHILRQEGSLKACLMSGPELNEGEALQKAQAFLGLKGMDLAKLVTCQKPYEWHEGPWLWESAAAPTPLLHVVAYDFGIKRSILRELVRVGCRVTVVPATTTAAEVLAFKPDGVFLSNGPGDPEPCTYAIEAIRALLKAEVPIFGICLGIQLLALACGAQTIKMKTGHHGGNHPVKCLKTNRVMITSQNHNFAVNEKTLGSVLEPTHISLFDGSLQGIRHTKAPAFAFQGHPEAGPGPHDATGLFDQFRVMMLVGARHD